ncbi:phytanoyl-CoA dioxygenase family protein [Acuticoccus sp.]|uniref:phytanoyl-CoA dioxygenase family protein n=1 Tax=Acuticoccus sp. TaxID=1904378 RepID=UPI003B5278F2
MKVLDVVGLPLAAPAIVSGQKNFAANRVIGSRRLNARGLHRWRVATAHAMSWRRRAALADGLTPAERTAFDRDGFVVREDALPPDLFARFVEEVATRPRRAWEMRQGHAVTRLMPLPARDDGSAAAAARAYVRGPKVRRLVGYVAGRTGAYNPVLQTIANDPDPQAPDPQNTLHADTFHPTAKFWLFLHDVGEDDGPFSYVPGSHRLTPERLQWEHDEAVVATQVADAHHASGSFRMSEDQLAALGYGRLVTLPVRANTLVVADTYGFHRRTPTTRPTVRTEIHGMLRRNPFVPWNGVDPAELPGIEGRLVWLSFAMRDRAARRGRPSKYVPMGERLAGEPATRLARDDA